MKIVLASKSPRRAEIMNRVFADFCIYTPTVDEKHDIHKPVKTAMYNAELKAKSIASKLPEYLIIAADTIICFDGKAIGKPSDMDEAYKLFSEFSGKSHEVITALAVYSPTTKQTSVTTCTTEVFFKTLSDDEIYRYYSLVNPLDKAGGYNINEHPEIIIDKIEGSFTNVMGLPIEELATLK